MLEVNSIIKNHAIYSDDKKHRYLLSRVWDEKKPIAMFISKFSGEADGIYIELTNNLITNNLYKLGYGGYYTTNLVSEIFGNGNQSDDITDKIIKEYAQKSADIIISWGSLNTVVLQKREEQVVKILKSTKKKLLTVTDDTGRKNLHILTPCVRNGFMLSDFVYINKSDTKTKFNTKTEKVDTKKETASDKNRKNS